MDADPGNTDSTRDESKIELLKQHYGRAVDAAQKKDFLGFGKFASFAWSALADAYGNKIPKAKVEQFRDGLLVDVRKAIPHMESAVKAVFSFYTSLNVSRDSKRQGVSDLVGSLIQQVIARSENDFDNQITQSLGNGFGDARVDQLAAQLTADLPADQAKIFLDAVTTVRSEVESGIRSRSA